MFNVYEEPESPKECGAFKRHGEPESPNEEARLRCMMNRHRQMRGRVQDI